MGSRRIWEGGRVNAGDNKKIVAFGDDFSKKQNLTAYSFELKISAW